MNHRKSSLRKPGQKRFDYQSSVAPVQANEHRSQSDELMMPTCLPKIWSLL